MESRNGFFQLHYKEDGTYLKLFPPVGDGKPFDFDELDTYLHDRGVYEYDLTGLNEVIEESKTKEKEIRILPISLKPENESLKLKVFSDNMYAVGRFYPPSLGGKLLTAYDIERQLQEARITHGIIKESIENFLNNRKYCEDYILAKGTPVTEGEDAKITYHFNIDNSLKPKVNEDGTVDFHQLDIISHVNQGDVLATLKPAISGVEGRDVYNTIIYPKKVVRKVLKFGKDIYLSEDGLTMYSNVSGHVTLTDDRVFVSNTYEVLADVDSSTGDIFYEGNVIVKGNVITGFCIQAKGDIIVNGVVEGATLKAGGHIILKRGIQGMSRGSMEAEGNIISKFIENSVVKAGGYISTEAILHSKVSARGDITVGGKKGFITGGEIRSGSSITIKTVGSPMGTQTLLEVGIDPKIMEEYKELEKTIRQKQKDLDRLLPVVDSYKKKMEAGEIMDQKKNDYIKLAIKSCISLRNELKEAILKYESMFSQLSSNAKAFVKVENVAYPEVKIVISNVGYYIRNEIYYSKFIRDKADIKIVGL